MKTNSPEANNLTLVTVAPLPNYKLVPSYAWFIVCGSFKMNTQPVQIP